MERWLHPGGDDQQQTDVPRQALSGPDQQDSRGLILSSLCLQVIIMSPIYFFPFHHALIVLNILSTFLFQIIGTPVRSELEFITNPKAQQYVAG